MLIPDFHNFSLEECKRLIIEYRKTRDTDLFHLILARFDKYILYSINNYKKYTSFLHDENPQEVYHTGILGFHKALLSTSERTPINRLLLKISTYINSELKQMYGYKIKEGNRSTNITDTLEELDRRDLDNFFTTSFYNHEKNLKQISVNCILSTNHLTDHERHLLYLKYFEDKTFHEIAKEEKLAYATVYNHITRALTKLRKYINKEKRY